MSMAEEAAVLAGVQLRDFVPGAPINIPANSKDATYLVAKFVVIKESGKMVYIFPDDTAEMLADRIRSSVTGHIQFTNEEISDIRHALTNESSRLNLLGQKSKDKEILQSTISRYSQILHKLAIEVSEGR